VPLETCVKTLRRALDAGLNVVDTAPGYEDGYSEQIVGQALKEAGALRDRLFVIDKIDLLDELVTPQAEASLTSRYAFSGSDVRRWAERHTLVQSRSAARSHTASISGSASGRPAW
jgi:aryl-alcohol dehydrogenase-like predicted oxidoreductase